jgi:catechol 2,3-dioxygenase-like lactoylglutathione lyase family enzyme
MMADQRKANVCWIDHCVVPVTDIDRWLEFYAQILGGEERASFGGGPKARTRFTWVGVNHVGGSIVPALPPGKGLGVAAPRYGYYIRSSEIDEHVRRLDAHAVPHLDPIATDEEGEEGTAIQFEDPDGNQLEFWAPAHLPEGAMDHESPVKVGRIASAAFESRDLNRTLSFYEDLLGLEPAPDTAEGILAFPLAAGGRLVYKQADELGDRTLGHTLYHTLHTALMVRDEAFVPILRHMWESLDEWDYDPRAPVRLATEEAEALPGRTCIHGAPIGYEWKNGTGRGDNYCDWDTNVFHFVPGTPVNGSMANPEWADERAYVEAEKQRVAGGR